MSMLWLVLGIIVLSCTVADLFASVVRPDGTGVLASGVARGIWRTGRRLHDRFPSHRLLAISGVVAVVALPLTWMVLMWAGWSMVLHGSTTAVLDASSKAPADSWSRIYAAGYALFTSGLGDKVPGGAPWQVAVAVATAMGLGLVTLAITFLVPVLQAANSRRSLARQISDLGHTTTGIVDRHERSDFATLAALTETFPSTLTDLAIQHRSYPVLDHLHSPDERTAFMPRLAALHDACLIAMSSRDPMVVARLEGVVAAVGAVLDSVEPDDGRPEPPRPSSIRDDAVAQRFDDASKCRCELASLVDADGWRWACVEESAESP